MTRIRRIWQEYPSRFWVIVVTTFIDVIGATLIFPFFALYITQRFNVGMAQAGLLLGTFSLASLVGSMLGGAIADKFGRPAHRAIRIGVQRAERRGDGPGR